MAASSWLHSLHIVNFDVDEGHVLEYSSANLLSSKDANTLSMAAMPDSQPASGGLGEISFAFRFQREGGDGPLWGFACFRARRVSDSRRGCTQKSIVLLTPLPLFTLFRSAVALLATAYFDSGLDALRDALQELDTWPVPLVAGQLRLPLLGQTLVARCVACEPGPTYAIAVARSGSRSDDHDNGIDPPSRLPEPALREARSAKALCSLGAACWTLWQLMLTGESIVILTPSPHQCSAIVSALPALVAPLACMADLRPYLTVHAAEWDLQLGGTGPPPGSGIVAGATNPMLARAPPPWLSLLTITDPSADSAHGGGGGSDSGGGGLFGLFARRNGSTPNLSRCSSYNSFSSFHGADGDWQGSAGAMGISWTTSVEVRTICRL